MKKKVIAIFMIFMMSLSLFACGSTDDSKTPTDADTQTEADGDANKDEDAGEITDSVPDVIIPNSIADESKVEYDLGAKAVKNFGMSQTLKKISYKDLSKIGDTLESAMEKGLSKSALSNFVIAFNEYEDDEADNIDQLAYVVALEDDDMEKVSIEMGAYHSTKDDKYYQYNFYTSETLTSDTASVKAILEEIKSAYGVTLSQSKVEKALKAAWKQAKANEDYYGVYQKTEYKGDGYRDSVTAGIDVGYDEEGNMSAYIYVERERLYTKQ